MVIWIILISLLPIFLIWAYFHINRKYQYWTQYGVKGPAPSFFKLGNLLQIASSTNPPVSEVELVSKYGSIYGTYIGLQPVLTVADCEWIKQIMVKDFYLFINRRELRVYHKYMKAALFFTEGEDWKRVRSITSPSFSTGKLRSMHLLMNKCQDKLSGCLRKVATTGTGLMDTKEIMSGFTLDVIASTSFAIETNTNTDQGKLNPLLKAAIEINNVSIFQALSYWSMPKWFNKLVKVKHFVNDPSLEFILNLSGEILKQRKRDSTKRNDMMQLLIDAYVYESELEQSDDYNKLAADMNTEVEIDTNQKQTKKNTLTDTEIIAQTMNFLIAGFDTSSSAISNCIFELSQQPEIQERLYDELASNLDELNKYSDEYYDIVMQQLPYFDAVIKETLRKYPPLIRLERRVMVDDYKVADIPLRKDQLVEISILAVHYNPEFYPQPDHFNPERFMPENKNLLVPYSYIPFGIGPRNCIGMRFAYQVVKLCLAKIVRQFRFSPSSQSLSKVEFESFRFGLHVKPFETKVELR